VSTGFSIIDSSILIVYLIATLSLGLYYSRRSDQNTSEYFLAGRNLGWFTIGISIFATNISSEHFIGLAGSGAARGLAVGQFELMAIFTLIILGWLLAPIYMKSGVSTTAEFLEKRFNNSIRKLFAGISIVIYIFTKISLTLFAGGILFHKIFGLNIYASAIIIVLITGLYSVIGGAKAVFKTHVFQGIILIVGAVTLTAFGLNAVGGFSGLYEKLPADYFNMFKPMSDPDFPWTGIIFGAPIIAFWYWCTDQYIVQRLLSAKSLDAARKGSLLAASLKILPIFILVVPGLIAVVLFPEINNDDAYPTLLASNILPMGFKGLVIAGLLAAIMSSLAGVFNSTASLFTNDFYKPRHPEATERKLVLIGRLSTTTIVVIAIICVPLIKMANSQIYLYLQSVQAYLSPPITAIFLMGFFIKWVTSRSVLTTLIVGELIGLSRLFTDMIVNAGWTTNSLLISYSQINFLHYAIFLFVFCMISILLLSAVERNRSSARITKIQYLLPDSLHEIKLNLANLGDGSTGFKSNLAISAFLFLIILSVWGLWY
jgi:solute:Na+ symporter, SSS family